MPRKALFAKATYLGGLPDTKPSKTSTYLWVTDLGIGHGSFGPRDRNFIAWEKTAGVGFESREPATSSAAALVTVQLKDGNSAHYRVVGKSGAEVRGRVQQFLAANGVPCLEEAARVEPDPDGSSR